MIVQDIVGMVFRAATAEELVEQMRESSEEAFDDPIPEFMRDVADQYESDSGDIIRTTTPEAFIADLISAGYMRELSLH